MAKAFFTDNGLESCVLGQQVYGGHFQRVLPRGLGLEASIRAGSGSLYGLEAAQF